MTTVYEPLYKRAQQGGGGGGGFKNDHELRDVKSSFIEEPLAKCGNKLEALKFRHPTSNMMSMVKSLNCSTRCSVGYDK